MENVVLFRRIALKIMRVTFTQMLLSGLLMSIVHAHEGKTQELLDRRVTLKAEKQVIKSILSEIEKQSGVKFLYSSNIVNPEQRTSLAVRKESLGVVLDKLLRPLELGYEVSERHIIINRIAQPLAPGELPETIPPDRVIKGAVKDENSQGLPGVSILLKGTQQGTISDAAGSFTLNVPDDKAVLVFSFVGYLSQEVVVGSRTSLDISLQTDEKALEEVVVVGYGEVNRRDLTGSVGRANVDDMIKAPVPSFADALAGRIAGVQVSSNDGQPGTLPNIVIRGANSLTQDNSPLYIVDGFPIEGNDNNAISPADIESIDVLKDASATAIYGARGANGVIIITTKRGKVGAPVINYNGYYGFQKDIRRLEVMDPYEFVKLQIEKNSSTVEDLYLSGQGRTLEDYRNIEGLDWYDRVLQQAAMQNHNISVSGGTAKSKYAISGSYLGQDGIFKNTGFNRYQGRISLDQEISEKLKIGLNTNYSYTNEFGAIATNNGGSVSANLMYSIWSYRPLLTTSDNVSDIDYADELTDPAHNPATEYRTNPLLQLENELREKLTNNMLSNFYAEYKIVNGLKLRVTGGLSLNTNQNNAFNNSKTRTGGPGYPQSLGPNGSQLFNRNTNFTNENTLTWSKAFGQHNLNIVGGYTQQTGKSAVFGATSVQISNEELGLDGMDEGTPRTIQARSSEWALQSFLGRVNYSFKSKYLFTASLRTDGSSKFSPQNRWGYFPSAAFAYRIGDEAFMKAFRFISDAKTRISYGTTGNNRVSDFAYASSIGTTNSSGYSFGNAIPSRGTYASGLGNPDLKWETTKQFNAGIDLSLWNDRLSFTSDYYYKRTDDLLLNAQLPFMTGYNTAFKNIGSVSNSGFEFSFNSINISNAQLSWNSSFNISFNRSKVLALTENQEALTSVTSAIFNSNPVYIAKIGHPVAMLYGPVFEGLYQYEDFNQSDNGTYVLKDGIPANGGNRATIKPGDARYRDINNDGLISLNDYTIIGNPNPDFIGGLNNNFEYKGFDLNIFLQFSYGNDVLNANKIPFEYGTNVSNNTNQYASYVDRWTPENPTSTIPRVNGYGANFYSSRIVEDASYLRLKTLSLGYSLPARILGYARIRSVRVYASAQNLMTWTKYSGIDPEVSTRHSTLTPGFDYSPYPRVKTVIFGLNATF